MLGRSGLKSCICVTRSYCRLHYLVCRMDNSRDISSRMRCLQHYSVWKAEQEANCFWLLRDFVSIVPSGFLFLGFTYCNLLLSKLVVHSLFCIHSFMYTGYLGMISLCSVKVNGSYRTPGWFSHVWGVDMLSRWPMMLTCWLLRLHCVSERVFNAWLVLFTDAGRPSCRRSWRMLPRSLCPSNRK